MWFFTGKGDQGKTFQFNEQQESKSDPVFDLIGTIDEATANLGLSISLSKDEELNLLLGTIQDQLSELMGVIAGAGKTVVAVRFNLEKSIKDLEKQIIRHGKYLDKPNAFIFAGKSTLGASVDVCRTVVRRAERLAVKQIGENLQVDKKIITYLNRLSSLLFVLRLSIDQNC